MKERWQKPITTRRYLHPPRSERLHTLWLEGKLVFGEVFAPDGLEDYTSYISSGIWFVADTPDGQLDFHSSVNRIRGDGIPVHALSIDKEGMNISIEAFSSFDRVPTCYVRLRLYNPTDKPIKRRIGFVLRTAKEPVLVKNGPDIYHSYSPEISAWLGADATWTKCNGGYRDGEKYVTVNSSLSFDFDEASGVAMAEVELLPKEEIISFLSYGEGEAKDFIYSEKKNETVENWRRELSRTHLPDFIHKDAESVTMCYHLISTILQNFNCVKGGDILLARQGGLSR